MLSNINKHLCVHVYEYRRKLAHDVDGKGKGYLNVIIDKNYFVAYSIGNPSKGKLNQRHIVWLDEEKMGECHPIFIVNDCALRGYTYGVNPHVIFLRIPNF